MKSLFSIICLLVLAVAAQAQQSFTITGRLENVPVKQVHITYWTSSGQDTKTANVVNNTYTLQFTANPGMVAWLRCGDLNALPVAATVQSIYLGPSSFAITHKNTFTNMTFSGSPENVEYQELYAKDLAYGKKIEEVRVRMVNAQLATDPSDRTTLEKQIAQMTADRKDVVYADFMRNHPQSKIIVHVFNQYAAGGVRSLEKDKVMPLFDMLPDSIKARPNAQAFLQQFKSQETFEKVANIGNTAPDFTQNDTLDNPISLSSFRGKYVLLDFWASWCGPCRADNPNVVKAYKKFHDKGFDILSVSLDQPGAKAKWIKAIHDDQLTWTHVSDLQYWNNAAVKLYGVQGIPQNFLIDPQGKIIARSLRGEDLDKKLSEILK